MFYILILLLIRDLSNEKNEESYDLSRRTNMEVFHRNNQPQGEMITKIPMKRNQ